MTLLSSVLKRCLPGGIGLAGRVGTYTTVLLTTLDDTAQGYLITGFHTAKVTDISEDIEFVRCRFDCVLHANK